jgi:hypothetical protein
MIDCHEHAIINNTIAKEHTTKWKKSIWGGQQVES